MSDLSHLSDEQLQAIYQKPDLSTVSDADLLKAYGANAKPAFGLGDLWPARLAKGIYGAAKDAITTFGDAAQGNIPMFDENGHTNPAIINSSADLATLASPVSPAARLGVGWAGALKTEKAAGPTQEALDSAAATGYDKARNLGVELPASNISGFADKVASKLFNEHGITPEQAPNTYKTLDRLRDAPPGATVTVPNLDALRQNFGATAGNFNPNASRDQFAAVLAKRDLADHLASLIDQEAISGPASEVAGLTKEANANYAAARRSEQIGDSLNKAELQTAATHSGRNLDNKTRQAFVKILTNDKAAAGFTQPELDAAESIVRGSKPADLMRSAGNFLGGGGGLGMLHGSSVGAGTGALMGGPLGAAIGAVVPPAIGYALKKGADASTLNKVEAFQQMVRSRSPLGESMPDRVAGTVSPRQALTVRALLFGAHPLQKENQ